MRSNKAFISILIVCLALIVWGNTKSGRAFKLYTASILSPLQNYTSIAISITRLRNENRRLKERVMVLCLENQRLAEYKYENKMLMQSLNFKERVSYRTVLAAAISRDPTGRNGILLINKGKEDGVDKNMVSITPEGVYGKVIESKGSTSLIQTIFNPGFCVAGLDMRSRAQGIIRCENGCTFDDVPVGADVEEGDTIITSGLGAIFPKGLYIGEIKRIRKPKNELFYRISVFPFSPTTAVEEVFIIVGEVPPLPEEEKPKEVKEIIEEKKLPKPTIIREKEKFIEPIIPEPRIRPKHI
jgi:rod shape-determining protein MreC